MAESLGEKLRKAREEREVSISEVAEQTRISALYLEAIERDDYRPLPGGIFNKGFVKSFAKYVGLDEAEALQDYARIVATQEVGEAQDSDRYKPEVLTDDRSGPSLIPTVIFAVIILGLLAWGVMLLVNYLQSPAAANGEPVPSAGESPVASNSSPTPENTPLPLTEEIKLTVSTSTEALSIQTTIDGETGSVTVPANSTYDAVGKESVKLVYYKGLAETIEFTLNGKKLESPVPPANWPRNGFEFEINKGNIENILTTGKIPVPAVGEQSPGGVPDNTQRPDSNSG